MAGAVLVLGISARATFSAAASPATAYGFNYTPNSTVYSNSITIQVQGGVGPYTYSWARTTGTSATMASDPTQNTTLFYAFINNGTLDSTWTCTVTDSIGNTQLIVVPCSLSAGFL